MSADTAQLLEVIALTPEDAQSAASGGADRLEIVREIGSGGLTPELEQFDRIRAAVDIPLRVMLRTNVGFQVSDQEMEHLVHQVERLRAAGADQFVFGILDATGRLDQQALDTICSTIEPCQWTLHHAFDHAHDPRIAFDVARNLPNLDYILSGGIQGDLGNGLQTLCGRAGWQSDELCWLAGGGLVLDYVAPLKAAGIKSFHIGRAARLGHSWDQPINPATVRRWKAVLQNEV